MTKAKILLFDLECAPKVAYVWKFWKANVQPDQVVQDGFLMSLAWQWFDGSGNETTYCIKGDHKGNDKKIVKVLSALLDAADIVIAHNIKKFDLPLFNARCVIHGMSPPSPYKIIDTLEVARSKFKFDSNRLDYVARLLGCKPKGTHKKFPGFTLWKECLEGNKEAWDEMEEYNIGDVQTLAEVYVKLRPWMDRHPNVGLYGDNGEHSCPKCGSHDLSPRGYSHTTAGKYRRLRCNGCGGWSRVKLNEMPVRKRKNLLVNGAYQ